MKQLILSAIIIATLVISGSCSSEQAVIEAGQWEEVEIILTSEEKSYVNPYTDVDVQMIFKGPGGEELVRPAFWDGNLTWKVRFASPAGDGEWVWNSVASNKDDKGLNGRSGLIRSVPYTGGNPLIKRGLLRMSPGGRNVIHADGTGRERVTEPAGIITYEWDAYRQPTGIHYSPFCDRLASWSDDPQHGYHFNRTHHDAVWLDFQWAQTGHGGEHLPYKVFNMYDNLPVKGSANGEPTYERISRPDNATGCNKWLT